jgi:hypothetical protein
METKNKFTWDITKCDEEIFNNGIILGILYKDHERCYGIPQKEEIQEFVEKVSNEIGFKIDFQYFGGRPTIRSLREAKEPFYQWLMRNSVYFKNNNLILDIS